MVQVHYDEGVANHIDLKLCAGVREDVGEESAKERAGQPLSRESYFNPGADAVQTAEGNMNGCVNASARSAWRGRRPWHARTLLEREPGDLRTGPRGSCARVRIGKARSRSQ